jgi:hypothetical protein
MLPVFAGWFVYISSENHQWIRKDIYTMHDGGIFLNASWLCLSGPVLGSPHFGQGYSHEQQLACFHRTLFVQFWVMHSITISAKHGASLAVQAAQRQRSVLSFAL